MNVLEAVVTDKKSKKEILFPGKLYSLTKLQNFLGKKYKMPMEKSLSIVQKLYENGYDGLLLDDHVPYLANDTRWGHTSRAYEFGYITGLAAATESAVKIIGE